MKCSHCLTDFHDHPVLTRIEEDQDGHWGIIERRCSACGRLVLELVSARNMWHDGQSNRLVDEKTRYLIRPKAANRTPPSPHVPSEFSRDYIEACLVLGDSPKASAALSRRCLQHILRETAKVKHQDLFREIQEVLDSGKLPSHIADSLDAVRAIGNFAAHPIKSTASGEIVAVEAGEAEWNLDTLESLFDYYFVQPALTKQKRAALDAKLKSAGKPTLK